jgi:hypothetical protein
VRLIHCPGDPRINNTPGQGWGFDSYTKANGVAGDSYGSYGGQGSTYTKMSQISSPVQTFVFLEDEDDAGYNVNCWEVNWNLTTGCPGHSQSYTWGGATIPMYHGNVSTMEFADGHAEFHKWTDPALIAYGKAAALGTVPSTPFPTVYDSDFNFVYNGYRFPLWQW